MIRLLENKVLVCKYTVLIQELYAKIVYFWISNHLKLCDIVSQNKQNLALFLQINNTIILEF